MFLTTHAAIGVLLAEAFPSHPLLAFFLGFGVHFLTDIIPHGDSLIYKGYVTGTKMKRAVAFVTIDGVICLCFTLLVVNTGMYENLRTTSWAIFGSVLPDLLIAVHEVTRNKVLKRFHRVHFFFHNLVTSKRGDIQYASGFAMQMVFMAAVLSRLG
ncbi:MAG: hypothetical protein WCV84_00300 [Patescibacteria group bacterium]